MDFDVEQGVRLARLFALARTRGDRVAMLALRARIHALYIAARLNGFWNDFAHTWFQV